MFLERRHGLGSTSTEGESLNDKLWNWSRSNDTKGKNLLNDWDAFLAIAVETGWTKEGNDMARNWISASKPEGCIGMCVAAFFFDPKRNAPFRDHENSFTRHVPPM